MSSKKEAENKKRKVGMERRPFLGFLDCFKGLFVFDKKEHGLPRERKAQRKWLDPCAILNLRCDKERKPHTEGQ